MSAADGRVEQARRQRVVFRLYVAAVSVGGLGLLAWSSLVAIVPQVRGADAVAWLLVVLCVVSELRPILMTRPDQGGEVTLSTPFAFALLLHGGMGIAALAIALASIIADVLARKPLQRIAFNVAVYTISILAAGAVMAAATGSQHLTTIPFIPLEHVPALLGSGLVFFALNNTLVGVVMALHLHVPVLAQLQKDFRFHVATAGVLLALSPIVVVIANLSITLLPFLILPVAAVYSSARQSLEKEYQALHDQLTGLPNRSLYHQRLRETLEESRMRGTNAAVMLIDLDRFKEVNDTLGHGVGDALLKEVSARLVQGLDGDATVARLGGDEFAVVVPHLCNAEQATAAAQSLLRAMSGSMTVEGYSLEIGASIGIALYPVDGTDTETLLQRADVAMYLAKAEQLGFQRYDAEQDPHSRERLALLGDLRRALDAGQFVLHYQPKADMRTGAVVGVEALIRWEHPTRGLLPPADFIALAEQSVLIGPLTMYVIDEALRQMREWRRAGLDLTVAVNLPVQNLYDPEFAAKVATLLEHYETPRGTLDLEITESTVMPDAKRAMTVLDALSALGIRLSVDDFGTGYSSLTYLRRLPVSEIKIDRSFVFNMATDAGDAMIVRSTIELARNLGLRVVAEGVETRLVWDKLVELGCELAQGYWISRPLPPDALLAWLERRPAAPAAPSLAASSF